MAEALYLVERTTALDGNDIDGVRHVLINNDDGDADAVIITAAIAACNAASGATGKFSAGYFDTVNKVSDLVTAGDLRTDQNFIAFPEKVVEVRT
jgi:hypothetical protein